MDCVRCRGETQARAGHKKFFNFVFRKRECLNCYSTFWTVECFVSYDTKFNKESINLLEHANNHFIENRNPVANWPNSKVNRDLD